MNKRFEKKLETIERHSHMDCKVFTIKIDQSRLNKNQKEFLKMSFLEAKWFYNHLLNKSKTEDIFKLDTKPNLVEVKCGDIFEERELNFLSSQMKQRIHDTTKASIKSLSTKKKKGQKVGALKFKTYVNSIPLIQLNSTYKILKNRIKVVGCKKSFYVHGLKQLDDVDEICNANLVRKPSGFYFKITTFSEKKEVKSQEMIGLDFGIETPITFSNGIKIDPSLEIDKRIRRAHRGLSKKKKRSKNRDKKRIELERLYEKNSNKKKDVRNKIVSHLKNNYGIVAVQDESIHQWHSGWFGSQIQKSSIGGIISGVKHIPRTLIVDKWFPSTQLCPECGVLNKHGLGKRVYHCGCGAEDEDRDVHSAQNILIEAVRKLNGSVIPMERRDIKLVESDASVLKMFEVFSGINHLECKYHSEKQEDSIL